MQLQQEHPFPGGRRRDGRCSSAVDEVCVQCFGEKLLSLVSFMFWSLTALAKGRTPEKAVLVSHCPSVGLHKCFHAALSLALNVTGRGARRC